MTRAMDTLILTRAVYRRRYGTDLPEASIPSRFLEEVPAGWWKNWASRAEWLGTHCVSRASRPRPHDRTSTHYAYEDEDQSASWAAREAQAAKSYSGKSYNSIDNIAEFFASRGKKFSLPNSPWKSPKARRVSARARRCVTPNTVKARSTSVKERVKKPRLRYNSLASV